MNGGVISLAFLLDSNLIYVAVSSSFFVKIITIHYGKDLNCINDLYINENELEKVETNFSEIASSKGLKTYEANVYYLPQEDHYLFGNLSIHSINIGSDPKCSYSFNKFENYILNNDFYGSLFISESAKEKNHYMLESDELLTLYHEFKQGDSLNFSYDETDFLTDNITLNNAFNLNGFNLTYGFSNFYNLTWIILANLLNGNPIENNSVSYSVPLTYLQDTNLWLLSWMNDKEYGDNYETNHELERSLFFGEWIIVNSVFPNFNGGVNVYNSPISLDIAFGYPLYSQVIAALYHENLSSYSYDLNSCNGLWCHSKIYPNSLVGYNSGFTTYGITLPNGDFFNGVGEPIINCNYPEASNPAISACQTGIYNIKWNTTGFVNEGQTFLEKELCWNGNYWHDDIVNCVI